MRKFEIPSNTTAGVTYIVTEWEGSDEKVFYSCTCVHGQFTGKTRNPKRYCSHIKKVIEREYLEVI